MTERTPGLVSTKPGTYTTRSLLWAYLLHWLMLLQQPGVDKLQTQHSFMPARRPALGIWKTNASLCMYQTNIPAPALSVTTAQPASAAFHRPHLDVGQVRLQRPYPHAQVEVQLHGAILHQHIPVPRQPHLQGHPPHSFTRAYNQASKTDQQSPAPVDAAVMATTGPDSPVQGRDSADGHTPTKGHVLRHGLLTCKPGWSPDAGTRSRTTLVSGKPSPAAGSSCGCSAPHASHK